MALDSTYARVEAILIDVLMIEDPTRVTPEARIVHDLGAESINIAEIVVAIENEFDLVVEDEAIQKASTVSALVACVAGAIASKTPS